MLYYYIVSLYIYSLYFSIALDIALLYYIIIIVILYYIMRFFRVLCASFVSAFRFPVPK